MSESGSAFVAVVHDGNLYSKATDSFTNILLIFI